MAKLLIRTEDKINSDWFKNIGCLKRGHIVTVMRDDQIGGVLDRSRKDAKIVMIPGLSDAEAAALKIGEPGDTKVTPTLRRRRMFRLDIDALLGDDKVQFDDKETMHVEGLLTLKQVRDIKVESDIPIDPNVV